MTLANKDYFNSVIRQDAQQIWEQLDEVGAKISQHPQAQREINLIAEAILYAERRGYREGAKAQRNVLGQVEAWLDGVRNEQDRTRFEQRWNTLQDEAAELRVLILRALA